MKNLNFLSVVMAMVLMVTAVSCVTPLQGGYDDDYYSTERRTSDRIYVNDPYYGTIVLERDPYSGRYYQVSPYGYSYGYNTPYRRYGNRYSNYNYRNDRNNHSGNNQQTEQQRKDQEKKREEARKRVLGG